MLPSDLFSRLRLEYVPLFTCRGSNDEIMNELLQTWLTIAQPFTFENIKLVLMESYLFIYIFLISIDQNQNK